MKTPSAARLKITSLLVFSLALLFLLFFDKSKHLTMLAEANPFAEDPYDAVGSFGIQLSFFVAVLSLLRAFRPYVTNEIPLNQLILILRGETVALLSILVTLAGDLVAMLRYTSLWTNSAAGWMLAGLTGGLLVLTIGVGLRLYSIAVNLPLFFESHSWRAILGVVSLLILAIYPANWRESVAGGVFTATLGMAILFISTWALATSIFPRLDLTYEDALDDLLPIYRSVKSRFRSLSLLENLTKINGLCKVFNWLNPRRHRWHFIILIALLMGGSLMMVEALSEGVSANIKLVLLLLAIFLGIEGAGVILGYFLFAEFLGMFRKAKIK